MVELSSSARRLFDLALETAQESSGGGEWRLGAVIAFKRKPLGCKGNDIPNNPANLSPDHFPQSGLHAEEAAIRLLLNQGVVDLSGCSIFVARITPGGKQGLARPCKRCMNMIRSVGCKRVVYSLDCVGAGQLSRAEIEGWETLPGVRFKGYNAIDPRSINRSRELLLTAA